MNTPRPFWIYFALAGLIFAVYGQVVRFDFTNYDDPEYVIENPHIALTADNVAWAMTNAYAGNWFPLTWISHMLDFRLFGLNSGMHHLTNVFLHALSSILLFVVLNRMTHAFWRSAFVAAFFALHPLRVESVAWVAERKDVLSTLFWILTIWFYIRYTEKPGTMRYFMVLFSFVLGLMSKPMLVTLPFTLLLLDIWPLNRMNRFEAWSRITEKLPFIALSIVVSVINFVVQQQAGSVMSLGVVPLSLRAQNALISYAMYLWMLVWPTRLVSLYPLPITIPAWQTLVAAAALIAVSALVVLQYRRRKYLAFGWVWYLLTLLPVIGLISFGAQARADRYTYMPLTGILIMLVWGVADLRQAFPRLAPAVWLGALGALAACVGLTAVQASYWRDSITLFRHTLAVSPDNHLAYNNLGVALTKQGKLDEAIECYKKAIEIPRYFDVADPYINIGSAMLSKDQPEQALSYLEKALEYAPRSAKAQANMGLALDNLGRPSEALEHFRESLKSEPENAATHAGIALSLAKVGASDEALAHMREALRITPNSAATYFDLGEAYGLLERPGDAELAFQSSVRLDPSNPRAHVNLGIAMGSQGKLKEAAIEFREAIRLKPDYSGAWFNLGNALAQNEHWAEAMPAFAEAVRLQPDFVEAREALERIQSMRHEYR